MATKAELITALEALTSFAGYSKTSPETVSLGEITNHIRWTENRIEVSSSTRSNVFLSAIVD